MHCLIEDNNENAAIFLVKHSVDVNMTNRMGESALHKAASKGFSTLVAALLDEGSNPNLQTVFKQNEFEDYRQTPLHLAISARKTSVVNELLERKDHRNIKPDYNIKNSSGKFSLLEPPKIVA